ncbi:MAG: TRAP transporter small permease subunit [Deltaproteobacteria bacterium]|jgi:TRAP-type C4-dicarboxylate transport system permease small subunit|nr:TRAP transporter small permease subunit [Deltaproteobacteria bacterium]
MLDKLLRLFERLDSRLVKVQRLMAIAFGLVMSLGMTAAIVSRQFFKNPLLGMEEIVVVSGFWFYMTGVALAASERSHLRVEVIPMVVRNRRAVAVIEVLTSVLALFLAGFILYWCFDLLAWSIEKRDILPATKLPSYVPQSSFPLAMGLLTLYFARDLLRDVRNLSDAFRGRAPETSAREGEGA